MMNFKNGLMPSVRRSPAVVEDAGTEQTEKVGEKVGPRQPTPEDAVLLGSYVETGHKLPRLATKSVTSFREAIAPARVINDDEKGEAIKEQFLAEMERWADSVIRTRQGIGNVPDGTRPPGWKAHFPAKAAAVAVLCGRIGSNLDAIVSPKEAKAALDEAYEG